MYLLLFLNLWMNEWMTWSNARSLCDSWASCLYTTKTEDRLPRMWAYTVSLSRVCVGRCVGASIVRGWTVGAIRRWSRKCILWRRRPNGRNWVGRNSRHDIIAPSHAIAVRRVIVADEWCKHMHGVLSCFGTTDWRTFPPQTYSIPGHSTPGQFSSPPIEHSPGC